MKEKSIKTIKEYKVNIEDKTIRFNEYCEQNVSEIPSRKGIKKAIVKGELRLNGNRVEGGRHLQNNDIVSFVDLERTPPKTYHLKLEIVYEDEDLAVIIKPAGINVSGNKFKTIQNALLYNLTDSIKIDKLPWALPVHRLDNQTSGLLIIAKTKTARVKLGQAFEEKTIHKKYNAVVIGTFPEKGSIEIPIETKKAKTEYKRISKVRSLKNDTLSLIELSPLTGRTHQLRIHCSALGFPILGDKIYGKPDLILKYKGLFLAAVELSFKHPITNERLAFSIPTPSKFKIRMKNEERRFLANQTK